PEPSPPMKGNAPLTFPPSLHPLPGEFRTRLRGNDFAVEIDRRGFLHGTLAGFAALSAGGLLAAQDEALSETLDDKDQPRITDGNPDTLFLTWQRDPTTTITATWVGEDLSEDQVEVRVAKAEAAAPA